MFFYFSWNQVVYKPGFHYLPHSNCFKCTAFGVMSLAYFQWLFKNISLLICILLRTLFSVVTLHLPYWNPQKKCPSDLSPKVSYNPTQHFYLTKTANQMFPSLHWLKRNSDRLTSSKMKSTHMHVYVCCVYATDLGFLNPYISCFFKFLDFCSPLPTLRIPHFMFF